MNKPTLLGYSVLGGLISAALSLLPLLPVPGLAFFSYFSALPLFFLGLSRGLPSLYGAALVSTLFVFLFSDIYIAGEFLLFSALGPAFLCNRALLHRTSSKGKVEWYPAHLLLRDLTGASALIMLLGIGLYLYFMTGEQGQNLIMNFLKAFDPQNQLKELESILRKLLPFLPGLFAFSWTIMMLINASLAQGLLVRFSKSTRPTPSFQNINVPQSFLIILGVAFLLTGLGMGPLALLGKNTICVFFFPYFLVGLSLVHHWLHKTKYTTIGLTLFYFTLLLFLWPALIVILLGMIKPWIQK